MAELGYVGSLNELVTLAERVKLGQSTGKFTGNCQHEKEPCLQSKRTLNPEAMCLPCRAYFYSSMALESLVELLVKKENGK